MNYCTHCRAPRMVGRYCGYCAKEYALAPVLVEDAEEDDDDDDGYAPRPAAPARQSNSGVMLGVVVVLGLLLLLAWNHAKPDINPLSPAYLQGKQTGLAYIQSGEEIVAITTALKVCDAQPDQSGDPAVDAEAEVAAANREAGCEAAFKEHEDAEG